MKRFIYACDIGSTLRRNFAWARGEPGSASLKPGTDISEIADLVAEDLQSGSSVALGFEAPLFLPVPESTTELSKRRDGESDRSWAALTGAYVATLALHQAAWILRRIRGRAQMFSFSLNWREWPPAGPDPTLLCWEAFISGKSKGKTHKADAEKGVREFLKLEGRLKFASNSVTANPRISMIAAAALWAGISDDVGLLHQECFVVKP